MAYDTANATAIAFGPSTMADLKRIMVAVGERIGKTHLTLRKAFLPRQCPY